jgi:hypothetical protein
MHMSFCVPAEISDVQSVKSNRMSNWKDSAAQAMAREPRLHF